MVAVLALGVGAWVVWHERARRISISFLLVSLAVAVYMAGFTLMLSATTADVGFVWARLAYLGIPFIVPAVYQFSMDLLGLRRRRRTLILLAWAVGVVYAGLAIGTRVLVTGVMMGDWGYITRITLWHTPIFAWSFLLLTLALRDYYRAYQEAEGVQKDRIVRFAIPLLVATAAFIDYLPSLGVPIAPWGFVVLGAYMATAAWTVARFHLPDLTPAFAADQIIGTMAEPLLVCDERGEVAFANPAATRLFGWTEEELMGTPLERVFGPEAATRMLEASVPGPIEMEVTRRGGDIVEVAVSTSRVRAKRGQQVGTVIVARDIAERRRAAREIERREQRFRALIEHARDTITIIDGEGRIIYESPATQRIMGYDPGESGGSRLFDRAHPDDSKAMLQALQRILAEPGATEDGEGRMRTADGEYRVFEFRATNLLHVPAVRGIVINARDVSDERQLGAQLQQAQKMEAIGQLAGGVAHDFNNILTAVQGNVALVMEQLPPDSPFLPELEEIRRGADRAGRLTHQLLSFSRRQVVRVRPIGLNDLVREMRAMLQRLIGEDMELVAHLNADPDTVLTDRSQLEQVVLNLVVNARDAIAGTGRIEVGTETVRVSGSAAPTVPVDPGGYVLLTVRDTGRGMDAETQARIFEPFFTTKAPGEGSGLGLSTVYGSVRQASGHIEVESQPGRGTTFSVYFPMAALATPAEPAGAEHEPAGEVSEDEAVVLVVEDEAPVRALLVRVLERRGYTVLAAADGEAAIELARSHPRPIDLLIADLVMPGMSGREAADGLTAMHPEMEVILISGYTADEVVRKGILTGQREFLPKPFTPDALIARVAAALGHQRAS